MMCLHRTTGSVQNVTSSTLLFLDTAKAAGTSDPAGFQIHKVKTPQLTHRTAQKTPASAQTPAWRLMINCLPQNPPALSRKQTKEWTCPMASARILPPRPKTKFLLPVAPWPTLNPLHHSRLPLQEAAARKRPPSWSVLTAWMHACPPLS